MKTIKEPKVTDLCRTYAVKAWTKPKTSSIEMDVRLAEAFAEIVAEILDKPWLGNATTGELIDELRARSDLNYRTVDAK